MGRLKMSDEASATSGTLPTEGSDFHCVPNSVLLVVKCT